MLAFTHQQLYMAQKGLLVMLLGFPAFGLTSGATYTPMDASAARVQSARSIPVLVANDIRIRQGLSPFLDSGTGTTPKQISTAIQELERMAQSGNAEAQFILGLSHIEGVQGYLLPCPERASHWLQAASMQGNIEATLELARLHESGQFGTSNYSLARYWYEHAANQGSAVAQYRLAHMYATGKGVTMNKEDAAFWLKLATVNGYSEAVTSTHFPELHLSEAEKKAVEERMSQWHPRIYQSIEAKLLEDPADRVKHYGPKLSEPSNSISKDGFITTSFDKPLFPWVSNTFFFEKQQRFWDSLLKRSTDKQ